ncbi:chromatin associated protein KTI12 [Trichodelitschia bisporula]|uniref:Chromatin associated protein KTI12 n=1 Tax=Trichodelitschia bisporula TaxID=703511 RepID=A0A6G1I9U2_9PEZI|nr:chromatin associated protein KTI12 [Trichodelitschia bisporula]
MPLLMITGYPSSGKTHRSTQLHTYFTSRISSSSLPLRAIHISDDTLNVPRSAYAEARTEKTARAELMSAVKRELTRDAIVIVDAPNYIKGFRYQMFCEAKAVQTPSCVVEVHIGTPIDTCRENNLRAREVDPATAYADEVFDNLVFRYEEPNGMTRWDSPLFTVLYDDPAPPGEAIWDALVGNDGRVKMVRPNAATVLRPATQQDYLYELDKQTSEIVAHILTWQKDHPGEEGGQVSVPLVQEVLQLPTKPLSVPQLQRIRRQFLALNRQHSLDKARIGALFVDYLNDQFGR